MKLGAVTVMARLETVSDLVMVLFSVPACTVVLMR